MEKADQIIDELTTLTREQLNELIDLFYKEKAKQVTAPQEGNKMCAR